MTVEDQILSDLAGFTHDPLGFVQYAFPWREPDSELADASGPEPWQAALLRRVGSGLSPQAALLLATTSGHGVAMSTFPDTRGVITANTEVQLKTKTWAELAKWYRLFIGRDFFRYEATCIFR